MKKSEFAIVSLVLGLISFLQLFGAEKALAAIAFGVLALWQIKTNPQTSGRWLAVLGIALGILYIIVTLIMLPQLIKMVGRLAG